MLAIAWSGHDGIVASVTVDASETTSVAPAPEHAIAIYEYVAATASCPLDWAVLGGLGGVTSDHTRVGDDARLLPDGGTTPLIRYEPLDGAPPDAVADSDGGAVDGDPGIDTTVGPMQFLPSTWAVYGVDGNGDGVADPENLWDAATGAANLLCQVGVDADRDAALALYFGTDRHLAWLGRRIDELIDWRDAEQWGAKPQVAEVITIVPPDPALVLPELTPGTPGADAPTDRGAIEGSGAPDRIEVAGTEQTPGDPIGPEPVDRGIGAITEGGPSSEPPAAPAGRPGPTQPVEPGVDEPGPAPPSTDAGSPPAPVAGDGVIAPIAVSGDWAGDGAIGNATIETSGPSPRLVVSDSLGRPYGRSIALDPLLAATDRDPANAPALVAGDWDGDGIDTLAVVVRNPEGVASALVLDRRGDLVEVVEIGTLAPGAQLAAALPSVADTAGATFWDERAIADGSTVALWRVGGILIEQSLADPLGRMLAAAAADGITLEGWGWRSHEAQIELRRAHCVDVWTTPASQCRPPTAIPGTSRHEFGVAIDFHRGGVAIAAASPEFEWLVGNAERFGFSNLPSEPWHWSIDGG